MDTQWFKRSLITTLAFITLVVTAQPANPEPTHTITLEVIRAFDPRLPTLSDEDMKEVFEETRKIVTAKLGTSLDLVFHDSGTIPSDELFKDKKYQNTKFYKSHASWKYYLCQEDYVFGDTDYKAYVTDFLKRWDLNSLRDFFPDKKIENYDDVYRNLIDTYRKKTRWLNTLETKEGDLVLRNPLSPDQSFFEWKAFMREQNKYDLFITNQLVVDDNLAELYPHSITKHAKIGGMSVESPTRKALDGHSVMVSILEEYGEIDGIGHKRQTPKEIKNKILGGFYLAHEIGHAFFLIPDAYDHGDSCLMNSSFECLDPLQGYTLLIRDMSMCPKCWPWVLAKETLIKAEIAYAEKEFGRAAILYITAANSTPEQIDGDYNGYIKKLYDKALQSYEKAEDKMGIEQVKQLLKEWKEQEDKH